MEYMIWESVVAVLGILMSAGYFPQAYRIWQKKDADDVSLVTFGIFAFGTTIWALYGFLLKDWVVFAGFIVGVIGSWLVVALAVYYRFIRKIPQKVEMSVSKKREMLD